MRYVLKLLGVGVVGFALLVVALIAWSAIRHAIDTPEERAERWAAAPVDEVAAKAPPPDVVPATSAAEDPPELMTPRAAQMLCMADAQDHYKGVDWGVMDRVSAEITEGSVNVTIDGGKRDGATYRLVCHVPRTVQSRDDPSIRRELLDGKAKVVTPPPECANGWEMGLRNRGKCKTSS